MLKKFVLRPFLFLIVILTAVVFLFEGFRLAFLYVEVGRGITGGNGNSPTIFYGRPLEIRCGDSLENLRFGERLKRLNYRPVSQKPTVAGTFFENSTRFRVVLRTPGGGGKTEETMSVDIRLAEGRVASLTTADGKTLDAVRLEPEEIGRILNPRLETRHQIGLNEVSPYLIQAIIACEDKRFYGHPGIDLWAVGRAAWVNFRENRFAQGGSTITQQVAKNFFLSPRKTFARKWREAELALALELRYSKEQILEMYINKIYLGQTGIERIFGVEDASSVYFSKRARDLNLEEAALLAAIIQAPNRYLLFKDPRSARQRRNRILQNMRTLGMISDTECRRASRTHVRLRSGDAPVHLTSCFLDYIQRITKDELGNEQLYHTGYRYYTTLDPIWQTFAEEAVTDGLKEIEKKARPAREPLQAALVAVDVRTGELVAMVGGRNYAQSRFNRAVDARRQPGSAFKPFVLAAALAQPPADKPAITLSTFVSGEPIAIDTPQGPWEPANFEDKEYGRLTVRQTIEKSINTATVRLAYDIGLDKVIDTARRAGITSVLQPVGSMPLGSFEVTPLELAYAYATFASNGKRLAPFPLFSVAAEDGEPIVERKQIPEQTFDARVAYLVGYALEGVVDRGTAGDVRSLKINFPLSGKTGTTNGNRDSWFVCYTPDMVCAVWVGYDSGADTGLTGATGALRISARFLSALYAYAGPAAAPIPEGVEMAVIDPETGYLATSLCPQTFSEAYLAGTAPTETCPEHPENPVMDTIQDKIREVKEFLLQLFE